MELQGESGITGWDDQNFREVHSQTMSTEKGHFSQDDLPTINVGKVMINLYLVYNFLGSCVKGTTQSSPNLS